MSGSSSSSSSSDAQAFDRYMEETGDWTIALDVYIKGDPNAICDQLDEADVAYEVIDDSNDAELVVHVLYAAGGTMRAHAVVKAVAATKGLLDGLSMQYDFSGDWHFEEELGRT
jgi:hypothetical protein